MSGLRCQQTYARSQKTLAQSAEVAGFGYWSGRDVRVEFRPVAAGAGFVFVRHDLTPVVRIPADVALRTDVPRRTVLKTVLQEGLQKNDATVEMVEHVLAALAGMEIDNCEIWVDAPEMPGCDGGAAEFVAAIDGAGTVEQDETVEPLVVGQAVRLGDDSAWIEAKPAPTPGLTVEYRLDYGKEIAIGQQTLSMAITPESFRKELAPCRTFLLESEAEWLASQGLGKRVTARDLLVFGKDGPVDNTLQFPDECVRHKILDVVGDLALAGRPIHGHITAYRSGHKLNAALVTKLLSLSRKRPIAA